MNKHIVSALLANHTKYILRMCIVSTYVIMNVRMCMHMHNSHVYVRIYRVVYSSLHLQLLAPEMHSERNKILQCVKFIVDNNFFDSDCPSK